MTSVHALARQSSLARAQQRWLVAQVAVAVLWVIWALAWKGDRAWALAGLLGLLIWQPLLVSLQFLVVACINRDLPERPRAGELLRAAWAELSAMRRVFGLWQPFQWDHTPDLLNSPPGAMGRHGVVLVHGYVCNRGLWTAWMRWLHADRRGFVAVNLEPVMGSIDAYAPILDEAVRRVTLATGRPPVVVGHSMGGLAVRAWLRGADASRVHRVVTIGSPHFGTWWGFAAVSLNARQMRRNSGWLERLGPPNRGQDDACVWTCFYSNVDNIVLPARTATLPGMDNRLLRGVGHVDMALHPTPQQFVRELLAAADAASSTQEGWAARSNAALGPVDRP